ncbi:hypothetical protein A2773_03410 [Candidatus Gottesmanbacteria bacterium RIFCSPHIGHO2_01_FULL_39_10]|uniref:Erythromycin biosynthesis sensory transduction protein eryC1 n=1 Tax=Candidatus Gottesmanbacteria bacterium RIFCSPHIGHO2_01_FULL_39_10 TaxID=1798375 RepID=A0A1F5ZPI1_9BACT|nr:MAG: hypothetical protein A2773_03410 [Candidatus Gottesmanbacteria bacterium RIFCSPHIGHO2_01_FULL_39_10]
MIPFFDIKRQNENIRNELDEAIAGVIDGGVYILGPKVAKFEKEFAKYIRVKYAVGVASGTDAISLALLAMGIGDGDEVILPANAYPSVFAISAIGAIPKLVDIDPQTYNLDPLKIEKVISKKTKAIIPVHLYGQPADLSSIIAIGKKYKIPVIEDCAQAHGAEFLGKKVGSIGDIGCFSFYPTKNLGAFGDGGMVVTNNKEIYEKVKLYRMYGEKERYKSILSGRNSRLDELQAAILLAKLKYLDKWNKRRKEISKKYNFQFSIFNFQFRKPYESVYARHIYHLYVIRTKRRDELKKYLEKHGIGTAIHYPVPIHLVPSFKYLGYKKGDFPESERASEEVLSLPIYPELRDEEVDKIAGAIVKFFQK